jgi:Protein of unknown function (DUF3800)
MGFEVYIDDSGSEPQSPIFFLAGFIASVEQWAAFSNEWTTALAQPPKLEYFKTNEAAGLGAHGQFSKKKGWDEAKRDDRLVTLTRIINKYAKLRVSVSIRHDLFEKYMRSLPAVERNLATDSPYVLLFTQIISVAILFADKHGLREPCDFIFDQQCGFSDEAMRHWEIYKLALGNSLRGDLLPLIGSPPAFRDEKCFLPLQAADLYAWQARNHYLGNHRVKNQTIQIPMNSVLRGLRPIPRFHRSITEAELIRQHASLLKTGEWLVKERPEVSLIPAGRDKKERRRMRRKARKKK